MSSKVYHKCLNYIKPNRSLDMLYCRLTPNVNVFDVEVNLPLVVLSRNNFKDIHPSVVYSCCVDEIYHRSESGEDFDEKHIALSDLTYDEFLRLFEIYDTDAYLNDNDCNVLVEGFMFEYNLYNKLLSTLYKVTLPHEDFLEGRIKDAHVAPDLEPTVDNFIVTCANTYVNYFIEKESRSKSMEFWHTVVSTTGVDPKSMHGLLYKKVFQPEADRYVLSNLARFYGFRLEYLDYVLKLIITAHKNLLLDEFPGVPIDTESSFI